MFRRALASSLRGPALRCSSGVSFDLSDHQVAIQDTARHFAREVIKPKAAAYDQSMEYPRDVFNAAWEAGLVNMPIPAAYGGLGATVLDEVLVFEEIAWGCSGMAIALVINSVAALPLLIAGTEAQKQKYLGMLTSAPVQAAYCVTEPHTGSDVAGIKTTARRDGDSWVINGQKMWITNGGVASWYFVLCKDHDSGKFVAFIVDREIPGVAPGPKEINMGQRCSDTRGVHFDNVRVPLENQVGEIGDGFKIAMKTFDKSRPVVAITAVGVARRAMEEARDYALERKTMGKRIAEHQAIAFTIAEMASGIEAGRLLAHKAAYDVDSGRRNSYYASCAKQFASDHCQKVCADAVQVFGGNGFNTGYPVEKLYRDCKILQIYEGTSQIQKHIISSSIFGEAMKK